MVETLSHGKTVTHMILKCNLSVTRGDKSLGTTTMTAVKVSLKNEFALFQT